MLAHALDAQHLELSPRIVQLPLQALLLLQRTLLHPEHLAALHRRLDGVALLQYGPFVAQLSLVLLLRRQHAVERLLHATTATAVAPAVDGSPRCISDGAHGRPSRARVVAVRMRGGTAGGASLHRAATTAVGVRGPASLGVQLHLHLSKPRLNGLRGPALRLQLTLRRLERRRQLTLLCERAIVLGVARAHERLHAPRLFATANNTAAAARTATTAAASVIAATTAAASVIAVEHLWHRASHHADASRSRRHP